MMENNCVNLNKIVIYFYVFKISLIMIKIATEEVAYEN